MRKGHEVTVDRGQLQNHEQTHVRWKRINMGGYKRHSQRPVNKSHIKAEDRYKGHTQIDSWGDRQIGMNLRDASDPSRGLRCSRLPPPLG